MGTASGSIKQTVLTVVQFLHTEMGEEFDTESQAGDMAMSFSDKAVRRGFIRRSTLSSPYSCFLLLESVFSSRVLVLSDMDCTLEMPVPYFGLCSPSVP